MLVQLELEVPGHNMAIEKPVQLELEVPRQQKVVMQTCNVKLAQLPQSRSVSFGVTVPLSCGPKLWLHFI